MAWRLGIPVPQNSNVTAEPGAHESKDTVLPILET